MQIMVQCECGQKFGMLIEDKTYMSKDYTESFMGSKRCPSPDCNKTVFVNADVHSAVATDEELINPKIDWDFIEEGDEISFNGNLFTVAYKYMWSVQNTQMEDVFTRLLYLRALVYGGNIIVEVRKSGFLSLFIPSDFKETVSGTNMWTEEELPNIKKKHEEFPYA